MKELTFSKVQNDRAGQATGVATGGAADSKHTATAEANLVHGFARTTRHARNKEHGTRNTEHDFPVCR